MSEKLYPCPICGGELYLWKRHGRGYEVLHKKEYCSCQYFLYLPTESESEAIDAANRRFTGQYDSHGVPICTDSWIRYYGWWDEKRIYETKYGQFSSWALKCRVITPEMAAKYKAKEASNA